jgi:hypothetical protein
MPILDSANVEPLPTPTARVAFADRTWRRANPTRTPYWHAWLQVLLTPVPRGARRQRRTRPPKRSLQHTPVPVHHPPIKLRRWSMLSKFVLVIRISRRCQLRLRPCLRGQPAEAVLLRGFNHERCGVGGAPWWTALQRRGDVVLYFVLVFEASRVNGDCGKHLKNAVEKDPTAETSVAGRDIGKETGLLVGADFVDEFVV